MRTRLANTVTVLACAVGLMIPQARADVDLVFEPEPQTVVVGVPVEIGLYAVSDDGSDQTFSAMDLVFSWDSTALELVEAIDGPHDWMLSGFMPDEQLDGLNDSLLDGDAVYTVLSLIPATATAEGLLVTTFRFEAVAEADAAEVAIEQSLGQYSTTKVLGTDQVNQDITGSLTGASVTIVSDASLSAADLTMPAGRTAEVTVLGEIAAKDSIGVTIVLELSPGVGSVGTVVFTQAPPSDIELLGDPWFGAGTFTPFDTDISGSEQHNGAVLDNGTFVPAPVSYSDVLAGFPVVAGGDARGVWDIKLCTGRCTGDDVFSWWDSLPQPLATSLHHAVLTVVELGDGDGSRCIDSRDFSEFQVCFTGPVGPVDPPAYELAPQLRCSVYDFDEDGDIDASDYGAFHATMSGPAP